jgi:hypothetical protein
LTKKDTLCVNILLSKYKVRGNWLNKNFVSNVYWTWRRVENSKHILSKRRLQDGGDGNNMMQDNNGGNRDREKG